MNMARLSALRTGRLYLPGNIPGTHFCWRLSQLQGHIVAGKIMSMKNSSDTIGNQTRDLPACSAVPQPTAPPLIILTCKINHLIYATAMAIIEETYGTRSYKSETQSKKNNPVGDVYSVV